LTHKGPSQTITDIDIYKGSEGLLMQFLENAPPDELYEDSPFKVILKLENKGATDIVKGYLSLGIEKDYMELRSFNFVRTFKLKGKSLQIPKGDQRVEEFSIKTKNLEPQSEVHTSNIIITACYDYTTFFSPSVCVDTDIYKENPVKKTCEVKDISASNQGAPVAITLIEEKILPKESNIVIPYFMIKISNVGNGEIIDINKVRAACSSGSFEHASWNHVYVNAFLGNQQLTCKPSKGDIKTGYVKIKDNEGIVRCVLEEGISTNFASYITTLRINISYGYTFTLSKEILIKKIINK
jgi:hypothetical protein